MGGDGNLRDRGRRGKTITIDHVGVGPNTRAVGKSGGIVNLVTENETAGKQIDHLPTAVKMSLDAAPATKAKKRRNAKYDRGLAGDAAARNIFRSLLRELPRVPSAVGPSTHNHILEDWIEAAATVAFPKHCRT